MTTLTQRHTSAGCGRHGCRSAAACREWGPRTAVAGGWRPRGGGGGGAGWWCEKGWAAAVWDEADDTVDDWLGELRRLSLLDWDEEERFYSLHDLVREYCHDGLSEGALRTATRRHGLLVLAAMREANTQF